MEDIWLERYAFKNKPFDHQRKYLERFWKKPVAALFADMGTGKSFMVINNIAMLYDVGKVNSALIIAPKGVYRNWVDQELPKHLPDHILHRTALWTPNPRKACKECAKGRSAGVVSTDHDRVARDSEPYGSVSAVCFSVRGVPRCA